MSAFLVGQNTLDIVALALACGANSHKVTDPTPIFPVDPQEIMSANANALRARYGSVELEISEWYGFIELPSVQRAIELLRPLTPVMRATVVASAIGCYTYQCSEGSVMEDYDHIMTPISLTQDGAFPRSQSESCNHIYAYGS